MVREWYPKDNCQSQNEFMETAVRFYCDYLVAEDVANFLPPIFVHAMRDTIKCSEDRIYQRQTQRRDELTEEAREVMRRLAAEMQSGTLEDQRPRPAAGPRMEVDSKLRRKIREKKIAMGHKPDDHEEQTFQ